FRGRGGARLPPGRARLVRPRGSLVRRAGHAAVALRIRLLSVGKDKEFTSEGAHEYAQRLRRFAELELVELTAASGPEAKEREAERSLSRRLPRGELWALAERGLELTSASLAERIGRLRDSAQDVTLCVGGG